MSWTLIKDFRPKGHAYYKDRTGGVSVADDSGKLPEDTDDGVLYIDDRIVVHSASLQLKDGKSTPLDMKEMQWLLDQKLAKVKGA